MKSPLLALLAFAAALLTTTAVGAEVYYHHHHHRMHRVIHRAAAVSTGPQVWVNLDTGIYHMPGERWYGRTKNGEYMSQAAANAAAYRETENGQ